MMFRYYNWCGDNLGIYVARYWFSQHWRVINIDLVKVNTQAMMISIAVDELNRIAIELYDLWSSPGKDSVGRNRVVN